MARLQQAGGGEHHRKLASSPSDRPADEGRAAITARAGSPVLVDELSRRRFIEKRLAETARRIAISEEVSRRIMRV